MLLSRFFVYYYIDGAGCNMTGTSSLDIGPSPFPDDVNESLVAVTQKIRTAGSDSGIAVM
jgi:hypothetical protein